MFLPNIDSIFFSIDISDFENNNRSLLNYLERKKEIAKEDRTDKVIVHLEKDKKFQILPNGLRFHSYVLHNDSYEIKISKNRSKSKNNFPVGIRIKSMKLWQRGYISAYEECIDFLKLVFKGNIIAEKLSRADICCHTDEVYIDSVDITSFRGNFKKNEIYMNNRTVNGMTFGSFNDKNILCRIYDKSLEIKTSNKTWFYDIWKKATGNIEKIWNVEFQLGRKFFRDRKIETVQDFILKTKTIWTYLTTEWISFINHDDMNITRCSTRLNWSKLITVYDNYVGLELIKIEKQRNRNAEKLIPQLVGVFTSYGACNTIISPDKLMEQFKADMKKYLKERKDNIQPEQFILDRLEYLFS